MVGLITFEQIYYIAVEDHKINSELKKKREDDLLIKLNIFIYYFIDLKQNYKFHKIFEFSL